MDEKKDRPVVKEYLITFFLLTLYKSPVVPQNKFTFFLLSRARVRSKFVAQLMNAGTRNGNRTILLSRSSDAENPNGNTSQIYVFSEKCLLFSYL
jgi:hypothetical protein